MDTREVVTKYFEYVNAGRWDDYLSLFDDNVVMDEQLMGHLEGIEAVRHGIEALRQAPKFQNHPLEMVVEGDRAMVIWHIETVGPGGVPIDAKGVNYYRIANGKIVTFQNYHDTAPFKPILDAMQEQ
jgi:ketosteroid isomerase-like protein